MYLTQPNQPVAIGEAKKNDPRVAAFAESVASGQVSLSAPCDAMYNTPTADDKEKLKSALDKILGR